MIESLAFILKSLLFNAFLHSKYTRALAFENLCQADVKYLSHMFVFFFKKKMCQADVEYVRTRYIANAHDDAKGKRFN